jgi:hypothetical protein
VATFGFLHTADGHVAVFAGLLREIDPSRQAVHLVDQSLLADARRRATVDDDLRIRIGTGLEDLRGRGAVRIVCTCSTIGGDAEEVGRSLGLDVFRVDRPMAEAAVAHGGRIAVVAALEHHGTDPDPALRNGRPTGSVGHHHRRSLSRSLGPLGDR